MLRERYNVSKFKSVTTESKEVEGSDHWMKCFLGGARRFEWIIECDQYERRFGRRVARQHPVSGQTRPTGLVFDMREEFKQAGTTARRAKAEVSKTTSDSAEEG